MLRTLARTAVIVVLAATVAGALYLAVMSRGSAALGQPFAQRDSASFDEHFAHGRGRGDGRPLRPGERHGREEASLGRGAAGVIGTALQVGCFSAVVVGLQKGWRRRQRRGRGRT